MTVELTTRKGPSPSSLQWQRTFYGAWLIRTGVRVLTPYSSRGIKRNAIASMLIAIIVMWMSAIAYWIAILLAAAETYSALHDLASQNAHQAGTVLRCALDLRVDAATAPTDCRQEQVMTLLYSSFEAYNIHDCIGTTALTVNVSEPSSSVLPQTSSRLTARSSSEIPSSGGVRGFSGQITGSSAPSAPS